MAELLTFHVAATLATALALGTMVAFAAMFTPLIFRHLEREIAAAFLRNVFPVYYQVLAALCLIAALPIWYRWEALVMAVVGGLFIMVRVGLLPVINRARDGRDAGDAAAAGRFRALHRLSVIVNLAQMVAVLVVFLRLVR